ncbi:MAG: RNA polymerase sigma factor SigJ [Acidimicrobiales bacterium]|nr:RNA polymerase sigma factor SigJ [Acidimicrobiales bacterium]
MPQPDPDQRLEARAVPAERDERFEAARARLHGVAYRMTGSISDADDLCQEAWIRWAAQDRSDVDDADAYLVTVVTRLALDRLRSAQHRRETYVGPYLPEPVVTVPGSRPEPDPSEAAELADSLTYAFLVLLDQLSPVERAVLLLHDVFGYPFAAVSDAVDRTEEAVRQIASRSRRKIEGSVPRTVKPDPEIVNGVLARLMVAIMSGDVDGVMAEMAPDVVQLDDGGAAKRAARRPVVGADRVARLWVNLAKRGAHLSVRFADVNGSPGLVFLDGDEPEMVMCADLDESGRIVRIFGQMNPDKLRHVTG